MGEWLDFQEATHPCQVLMFLLENAEEAYTQTEIHEATGIEPSNVGEALSRLEDRGLVQNEGRKWTVSEDDRLASYAAQQNASSESTEDDYYNET